MPVPSTPGMSMTDHQTATITDREALAAKFPHRVLLAPPTSRTIPIMALRAEAERPLNEIWSVSAQETGALDKQAYGRVRTGKFGDYQFVTTRHRTGLRTASYALWVAFTDEVQANRFTTEHPRYGFDNLLATALRRKAKIEHDLEQGIAKGRFDLSEITPDDRYHKAKLYVTSIDDLHRLETIVVKLNELGLATGMLPDNIRIDREQVL